MSLRSKISIKCTEFSPLPQRDIDVEDTSANRHHEGTTHSRRSTVEPRGGGVEHPSEQNNERGYFTQDTQPINHPRREEQEPDRPTSPPESLLGSATTEEKLPSKSQRSLVSLILVDTWFWEVLCWVLGIACLAAIVIILYTHDEQPMPEWSSGITLNALVSVFVSIAKAALLFPVAESIGQLKWVWFATEGRKLQDFEAFDNASKGLWSSILLLCTPKAKRWVSLGAIAMIVGAVVEPFTQQIISFPQRLAPSRVSGVKASVAFSQNFTAGNPLSNMSPNTDELAGALDTSMMLSIYSGVFHPANISIEPLAPDCTTGNCTFSDFFSIGVCTRAANITHLLGQNCDPNTIPKTTYCSNMLPNGMYMDSYAMIANISTTTTWSNSTPPLVFSDIAHPIVNIFVVYSDFRAGGTTKAVEFVFEYCVKRYRTAVSNGQPHTEELAVYTNYTTDHYDPRFMTNSSTLVFSIPDSSATYNVTLLAQSSMTSFMHDLFRGIVRGGHVSIPQSTSGLAGSIFSAASPIFDAISQPPFMQAGMERLINNVAMSITNNIRSRNNNGANGGVGAPLQGVAYSAIPFVHVQWEWITMLVVLVALTLVLLGVTVLQSRRAGTKLWKGSSLAVLRAGAGADEALRQEWAAGGMGRMGVVEKQGESVDIVLINEVGTGGGGWRLVRR